MSDFLIAEVRKRLARLGWKNLCLRRLKFTATWWASTHRYVRVGGSRTCIRAEAYAYWSPESREGTNARRRRAANALLGALEGRE